MIIKILNLINKVGLKIKNITLKIIRPIIKFLCFFKNLSFLIFFRHLLKNLISTFHQLHLKLQLLYLKNLMHFDLINLILFLY